MVNFLIPRELLNYPRLGCINVHASLLPKLRGGAPINRAIMEGYTKTGITVMYMNTGMDAGDIITQEEVEILSRLETNIFDENKQILTITDLIFLQYLTKKFMIA